MRKTSIPIIVLAIFSISILFMFDYFTKPANALSFYNVTVTENIGVDSHTINSVAVFTSIDFDDGTYKTWRASDGVVLYSGNADDACTTAGLACTYNNVECSGDVCWLHADVAVNDRLVKLIPSTGADSICVATGESSTSNNYLLLSGFLYLAYVNGANEKLRQVNIVSCNSADFVDTADLNVPTPKPVAGATISGVSYVALSGSTLFDIINVNTMTVKCQSGTVDNFLGGVFHSSFWYIGSDDGLVRKIDNSCVTSSTITASTLGCTGGVTQDISSNGNDLIFVACDIASAGNKIIAYNTTANSVLATYSCGGDSTWGDQELDIVSYSSSADAVACSIDDQDIVRTVLQQGSGATSGDATVCIDTNLDGITDLCFTDSNGDGIADNGILGGLGAYRSNQNVTHLAFEWNCAFGIGSCTNTDPKTNGAGLFLLLIVVIISYAFLVAIHYQALHMINKANVQVMDILNINPILLLVVLIIDIGLTFYLGWIPDLIFYTIITVSVVGIVGFGLYKKIVPSSGGG